MNSNTRYHGEWYGNAKHRATGYQLHGEVKMGQDRVYRWEASYGGKVVASGSESTLPAAKEAVDIALSDAV